MAIKRQPKRRIPRPVVGSERRNNDRAKSARRALAEFGNQTGLTHADGLGIAMTDLLCDFLHLCDQERLDFAHILRLALTHHDVEARDSNRVGRSD